MIIKDGRAKLDSKEYVQEVVWSGEKLQRLISSPAGRKSGLTREKIEDLAWTVDCLKRAFEEEMTEEAK